MIPAVDRDSGHSVRDRKHAETEAGKIGRL